LSQDPSSSLKTVPIASNNVKSITLGR
jgi:hypothetical protein